ncbi:MAG TPA: hypothetical protein VIK27_02620, partial [Candidatus Aquilonibacter sp.]
GERFLPTTREVSIGRGVVYRPVRFWTQATYAGEGIASVRGDSSGCAREVNGLPMCSAPSVAIHRAYWNVAKPSQSVSAFLSYPGAMGACDEYFWEAYLHSEPERWIGPNAEAEMEAAIVAELGDATGAIGETLAEWRRET